jgi:dolichyl-phosphate beta-glucosyltransferase
MPVPIETPFLSAIIPAYNEAERLPATLNALAAYFAEQPYSAEVLVVDDGSTDGTADLVRERVASWPVLRLVAAEHGGKGHAIKLGLLASAGEYTFLCDADLSMPISELPRLLAAAPGAMDIAIASREGHAARRVGEPLYRHVMGRVFNGLVRALALPGIQDSQCGFKCLRGDLARELAEVLTVTGWGFDVEMLYVARQWGARIVEVPITWYYAPSSRIQPLADAWGMTREVLRVRRSAQLGLYARRPVPAAVAANAPGGQ